MFTGAPGRKYLPYELNIKKMHEMFVQRDNENIAVKYSLYKAVFHYSFNLAFGRPATDVCGTCMQHKLKLKDKDMSDEERTINAASFLLHRRRARAFYDRLNLTCPNALTICFDVMENLCLPRTPVGQAYYSRQLYMYVFAVVVHNGKESRQPKENVMFYVWREDQAGKDSNIIASAVFNALSGPLAEMLASKDQLRVFSDSCYGQNKNMAMMSMLLALVAKRNASKKLKVEYNFPIRGHSFLPADRVFGRVEQSIRKQDTIMLPKDYENILASHGKVMVYGTDWSARDYKAEVKKFTKVSRTFKISEARVIELDGNTLSLKSSYTGHLSQHTVLKRGKSWSNFAPCALPMKSHVKPAKKADVFKLLNEMGAPQRVVSFYQDCLAVSTNSDHSDDDEF